MLHSGKMNAAIRLALLLLWMPLAAGRPMTIDIGSEQVLLRTPLIDGRNDLPWDRDLFKSDLSAVNLKSDTKRLPFPADAAPLMTDIPRMRAETWRPVLVCVDTEARCGARNGLDDARTNGPGQAHGGPPSADLK